MRYDWERVKRKVFCNRRKLSV